eukprot:scaffold648391_cov32-Prasinocladus_malaysianus.AAC.1
MDRHGIQQMGQKWNGRNGMKRNAMQRMKRNRMKYNIMEFVSVPTYAPLHRNLDPYKFAEGLQIKCYPWSTCNTHKRRHITGSCIVRQLLYTSINTKYSVKYAVSMVRLRYIGSKATKKKDCQHCGKKLLGVPQGPADGKEILGGHRKLRRSLVWSQARESTQSCRLWRLPADANAKDYQAHRLFQRMHNSLWHRPLGMELMSENVTQQICFENKPQFFGVSDKGRSLPPAVTRSAEKPLPVNQEEVESWRASQKLSKFCNCEWWNLLGMR